MAASEDAPETRDTGTRAEPSLVVGVGYSAGGLEAAKALFRNVPDSPGMAFVVVAHLDPDASSNLAAILAKATSLRVVTVSDGMALDADTIYTVPAGSDIELFNGVFHLFEVDRGSPRATIDRFFRSLARDKENRAVGIVLSGMGSDGTLGLQEVKAQLGLTVAQDPATARFASMPEHAIESGSVDVVLAPEEIPERLLAYAHHEPETLVQAVEVDKPSPSDRGSKTLDRLMALLRSRSGHDFSSYKRSTLTRRIERRLHVHQIDRLEDYVQYVRQYSTELDRLFKELLIGVTSFFREPEAFEALRKKVIPQILNGKEAGEEVRVWVPACSTGEEAYSIAILMHEYIFEHESPYDVQIFATDIDPDAVDRARHAKYPRSIAADVSPERLDRYFFRENDHYRPCREIRDMLVFAEQNLVRDPPFTRLDLISCRNLLIYLDGELQDKVVPLLHYSLAPGGFLFLGSSESISGYTDLFKAVSKTWKIYEKKPGSPAAHPVDFPFTTAPVSKPAPRRGKQRQSNLSEVVHRFLLDNYTPACVVVDENNEVAYIHGRTGKFLEPAQGQPNPDVLQMAREGLRLELASALRSARGTGAEPRSVYVKTNGGFVRAELRVVPFDKEGTYRGFLAILLTVVEEPATKRDRKSHDTGTFEDTDYTELERELSDTRERLQSTIEELEASNEELKSANEEYQSTNEELQSANEELESSKEEMQSLNEELSTVNAELRSKIDEVSDAYGEMKHLLDHLDIPILFLDTELRVQQFSSAATDVVSLIDADVGRPVDHIATKLAENGFLEAAQRAVSAGTHTQRTVRTTGGSWYRMSVSPYHDQSRVLQGVIISFINIDEEKLKEEELNVAHRALLRVQATVDAMDQAVLVLDADLSIDFANSAYCRMFEVERGDLEGAQFYEVAEGQWEVPRLRKLLEQMLPNRSAVRDYRVTIHMPDGAKEPLSVSARLIRYDGEERIMLTVRSSAGSLDAGAEGAEA